MSQNIIATNVPRICRLNTVLNVMLNKDMTCAEFVLPSIHIDLNSQGWLYGSLNGIVGLFPAEYVKHLARHEVDKTSGPKPVLYRSGSHEAGQHLNTARVGATGGGGGGGGSTVAQSVEHSTPGEEVPGSISAVAAHSLLVGSVSV